MIININANQSRSENMCDEVFVVNCAEDAAKTIELMRYLQRWRPERKIVERVELDNDIEAFTFLRIMEELEWNYPLYFRSTPTPEMQALIAKNHLQYTT